MVPLTAYKTRITVSDYRFENRVIVKSIKTIFFGAINSRDAEINWNHGLINEREWQLIILFKNILNLAIILILEGEIKKQRDLEYFNLFL